MLNRLNDLSFVIGAFFTVISLILFGNALLSPAPSKLNIYSATGFLIFGLMMMFSRKRKNKEPE
jgi:putative Ca2+/H+ antiporter (TMEM165/GDT1 family)